MPNRKPFEQQEATGSDGKQYKCTVPGDDIVDGVVRASEQWMQAGDTSGQTYCRSEQDVLLDRFDSAMFIPI